MREDGTEMKRAWMRAVRRGTARRRFGRPSASGGCAHTRCSRCVHGSRKNLLPVSARSRPLPQSPPYGGTGDGTEHGCVVRFDGELDLVNAASFGARLRVAGTPGPRIVVDLRDVTFMDGSPLRELCAAEERVVGLGGWIRVVYRQRSIAMLFHASGLARRFPRYATVEDAQAGRSAPDAV